MISDIADVLRAPFGHSHLQALTAGAVVPDGIGRSAALEAIHVPEPPIAQLAVGRGSAGTVQIGIFNAAAIAAVVAPGVLAVRGVVLALGNARVIAAIIGITAVVIIVGVVVQPVAMTPFVFDFVGVVLIMDYYS